MDNKKLFVFRRMFHKWKAEEYDGSYVVASIFFICYMTEAEATKELTRLNRRITNEQAIREEDNSPRSESLS